MLPYEVSKRLKNFEYDFYLLLAFSPWHIAVTKGVSIKHKRHQTVSERKEKAFFRVMSRASLLFGATFLHSLYMLSTSKIIPIILNFTASVILDNIYMYVVFICRRLIIKSYNITLSP